MLLVVVALVFDHSVHLLGEGGDDPVTEVLQVPAVGLIELTCD